ncbi:MAG: bifunctional diguanylate cyclase/phosphodiesterase [Cyanobacteria bacterium J06600_6]
MIRINNQLLLQTANQEITALNQLLQEQFNLQKSKNLELGLKNLELEQINIKLQQEVLARKRAENKLEYDAFHDNLTGLPNRSCLLSHIDLALNIIQNNPQYSFSLLFIDLNRFKIINDTLGHAIGDLLLIEVANTLQRNIGINDIVARLGGDEFVIFIEQSDSKDNTVAIAQDLLKKLQQSITIEDRILSVGASIGIVYGSAVYQNSSQILRDADIAMYQAKKRSKIKGKNWFEIFDESMLLKTLQISELERDLRYAVAENQLHLNYQPIISLQDNQLEGFEALIRWHHPQKGFISPGEFIPLAEDIGLIVSLGDWVFAQACQQLTVWQRQFAHIPASSVWKMSINVSSQQFQERNFIDKLEQVLLDTGLDPSCLKLEITERVLIESEAVTQKNLQAIEKSEIKLSIDDFGTGYSSFSYLRSLPIDNLKIDRSFIENIDCNQESLEIVKTIITLAHTLGMDTIAEGIETEEQMEILKTMNCEMAQGYYFAKPLSVSAMASWLHDRIPQTVAVKV